MITIKLASAQWCGPCRAYKPVLKQFCSEKSIALQEIDVDTNPDFVQAHNIASIPVTMVFRGDQVVYQSKGAMSRQQLESVVNSL